MARVVFTEPAEYDLLDIEYYIFVDLCNPQAAQRISDGILGAADKLADYPEGHPLVSEELLGRMGIRITYFDNYNIFYYYDMQNDVVYIIRVLYNKVDWKNILKGEFYSNLSDTPEFKRIGGFLHFLNLKKI